MDKEDAGYIYNGVLLSNQKEWNLAICNYVDGIRDVMLSKVRERQISYEDFKIQNRWTQGKGNKKYKTREGDKTEETHKYGEQTEGCWRGGVRGDGI